MAEVREKAFSTTLSKDIGTRVKMIAQNENRSSANVIESAVKVFTLLPKDVRDVLIAAASGSETGRARLKEFSRSVMYLDAMRRLSAAADEAAEHTKFAPDPSDYDDAEVVGRST